MRLPSNKTLSDDVVYNSKQPEEMIRKICTIPEKRPVGSMVPSKWAEKLVLLLKNKNNEVDGKTIEQIIEQIDQLNKTPNVWLNLSYFHIDRIKIQTFNRLNDTNISAEFKQKIQQTPSEDSGSNLHHLIKNSQVTLNDQEFEYLFFFKDPKEQKYSEVLMANLIRYKRSQLTSPNMTTEFLNRFVKEVVLENQSFSNHLGFNSTTRQLLNEFSDWMIRSSMKLSEEQINQIVEPRPVTSKPSDRIKVSYFLYLAPTPNTLKDINPTALKGDHWIQAAKLAKGWPTDEEDINQNIQKIEGGEIEINDSFIQYLREALQRTDLLSRLSQKGILNLLKLANHSIAQSVIEHDKKQEVINEDLLMAMFEENVRPVEGWKSGIVSRLFKYLLEKKNNHLKEKTLTLAIEFFGNHNKQDEHSRVDADQMVMKLTKDHFKQLTDQQTYLILQSDSEEAVKYLLARKTFKPSSDLKSQILLSTNKIHIATHFLNMDIPAHPDVLKYLKARINCEFTHLSMEEQTSHLQKEEVSRVFEKIVAHNPWPVDPNNVFIFPYEKALPCPAKEVQSSVDLVDEMISINENALLKNQAKLVLSEPSLTVKNKRAVL